MARLVKEEEYNAKRNEILDVTQSLIYSKGYEQMTIQDILDQLHISRGALYHYFESKQALLEALIDRMGKTAEQTLLPIVEDPNLDALQKFRRYFEGGAQWKSMQKELILSLLPMWYSDHNAFVRQKMTVESLKGTTRLLEPIIRQGIEEKVFTVRHPEQVAKIIVGVALSLTDTIIELLLPPGPDQATFQKAEIILDAYFDTIERILGAPAGSLKVFKADDLKEWWGTAKLEPASE